MKRFIRVGDELADEVTVVVRGGALDTALLRQDALRTYAIYATFADLGLRRPRPGGGRANRAR